MTFKSWIRSTIIWLLLAHASVAFFWVVFGLCLNDLTGMTTHFDFPISLNIALVIMSIYMISLYAMTAVANHDIVVESDKVRVINRVWGFRDSEVFGFSEIEKIVFTRLPETKFSWTLVRRWFAEEYKWIDIYAAGKKHRFLCCGIEYDKSDKMEPAFEDLFRILRLRGVPTEWV